MRFLLIPFVAFAFCCQAQNLSEDLLLIKNAGNHEEHQHDDRKSFFRGILSFYSKHISDQIINDCIYEESCSTFSQGAFREYGFGKGLLLTTDRMMRCNRLSQSQVMPVRFNKEGKISDHWENYAKEK